MLRDIARGSPGTIWRRVYNVNNPGAGNPITFAVPAHRAWQLLAVSVKFTASADVGDRIPVLAHLDNGGVPLAQIASPTAVPATVAPTLTWAAGIGSVVASLPWGIALPLPGPWFMLPGESLLVGSLGFATDAYTLGRITVVETNTGDPAFEQSIERGILDRIEAFRDLINL